MLESPQRQQGLAMAPTVITAAVIQGYYYRDSSNIYPMDLAELIQGVVSRPQLAFSECG